MSNKKFLTGGYLFLFGFFAFLLSGECSEAHPFKSGEELTFRVIYFAMPAGTAKLKVEENTELEGTPVYRFKAEARSSALFSLFYRVEDMMESFVDTKNLLPIRFEKHLREGPRYRSDEITTFDRKNNHAETENRKMPIPESIQDPLSSFYHLRLQPLEVGKSVLVNVNSDEKNYNVEVKVLRKETMKKWGKEIDTVVVQPIIRDVKLGGILEEKGDIFIWLTDDEKKIPLFIEAKVIVGQLSFVLLDYKPGESNEDKSEEI